jgi:pyruvate formate lyase activating enzyme
MTTALRCTLCHHRCLIPPGGRGFCGVRENRGEGISGGDGVSSEELSFEGFSLPYYGYVTAAAVDPIEKKPLYHFRPGSRILSLGFAGCNLRCPFCQNWQISQLGPTAPPTAMPEGHRMRPEDAVALARENGPASPPALSLPAAQIAYTYSEPLIHIEFLKDCMELAHEQGIANVLVSNGCINLKQAEGILPLVDAANIDLKCFSEKTYREVLGGDLETVLNCIRAARRAGVCLELTTLVVPGLNDSEGELDRCAEFIAALEAEPLRHGLRPGLRDAPAESGKKGPAAAGRPLPWHLSAYHPSYRWDAPPTDSTALLHLAERARRTLPYVYTGNITGEKNDTLCPHCGAVLVRRRAYRTESRLLPPEKSAPGPQPCRCASCGADVPVYW